MTIIQNKSTIYQFGRNGRFDSLRLLAALFVLWSHAFPLGGEPAGDPILKYTGIDTLGALGVAIFFVLSGYLLTLSWERNPNLIDFLHNRALRIYPALIVVCAVSIIILGPLLTRLDLYTYWTHPFTSNYWLTATGWVVRYQLPGVFEINPHPHAVNGSLWSLPYEIRCYLLLLLVAFLPLKMRTKLPLVLGCLILIQLMRPQNAAVFDRILGLDAFHLKLGIFFFAGSTLAVWREYIRTSFLLMLCFGMAMLSIIIHYQSLQLVLIWLIVSCIVVYTANHATWLPTLPESWGDWSYGVYLYGFPVQQVLAYYYLHHYGILIYALFSTILTLILGALSWHWIERRAMRFKK